MDIFLLIERLKCFTYPFLGSKPHQNFGLKFGFHVASQILILSEDLEFWYSSCAAYCFPQFRWSTLGYWDV